MPLTTFHFLRILALMLDHMGWLPSVQKGILPCEKIRALP